MREPEGTGSGWGREISVGSWQSHLAKDSLSSDNIVIQQSNPAVCQDTVSPLKSKKVNCKNTASGHHRKAPQQNDIVNPSWIEI